MSLRAFENGFDWRSIAVLFGCALASFFRCPSSAAQGVASNAHITFETPAGYQQGFRDYLSYVAGANTAASGPVAYVGNYGTDVNGANTPFFRLADDNSGNGIPGAILIVTTGPDGSPQITTLTDFDDFHTFNIAFDDVTSNQTPNSGAIDAINVVWYDDVEENSDAANTLAEWQAAEALRISDWQQTGADLGTQPANTGYWSGDPSPPPRIANGAIRRQRNGIGILYGLRIIERNDYRWMNMSGGILGNTRTEMWAENHILGPSAGLMWVKSRGPFTVRLQGLASIGYNSGDIEQSNAIGTELVPGAVNRLLYAQPTHSYHQDSHDEFSPNGELRADINMRITSSITFAMNWSGVVIDNALETENRTRFYLPDFGLQDPGNQRLIVHNFFCGFEVFR